MTTFKSFNPKKFSSQKELVKTFKIKGHSMDEFCANCGFPMGAHFVMNCPQMEDPNKPYWNRQREYQTIKPLKNGRKKSCQQ